MTILFVETDPYEVQALSSPIEKQGHTIMTADSVKSALKIIKREPPELIMININGQPSQVLSLLAASQSMEPQLPVIVMSRKPSLEDAVSMMKGGAHDFWVKPILPERMAKTMEWLDMRSQGKSGHGRDGEKRTETGQAGSLPIITRNPHMLKLKDMAARVAMSSATVFIQGESGTGKELFARFIHLHSERRDRPFVALNCAALPETLMESELFGHEKGAFTGAIKAREGKFELAHTGTLFLDEVTEIPVHLQSKLLRTLQESEVDRIGGKYPISVDVRVIATTNLVMEEALKAGQFRRDLYYRLNVIPLKVPPLRERREDIPLLCKYFVDKYNQVHRCTIEEVTPEAMRMIEKHPWPGNVRELENVMQRAMLLSRDRSIGPEHIIFDNESEPASMGSEFELMPISEMERLLIHKALAAYDGNRTRAAEILGISVRTLRNKLHEYAAMNAALGPVP